MKNLNKIKKLIQKFTEKEIRVAVAESCTGGFICHMITNISGSSKIFDRGVISYSNQAKIDILNVSEDNIIEYGAVSKPVAYQMAENVRKLSKTDLGVGVTGIAGPTGGTEEKPVGLVYIGFSQPSKTEVFKKVYQTDRITFKEEVLEFVISLFFQYLDEIS